MNAVIDAALKRSRTVLFLFVFLLIGGVFTYTNIPKESIPDVKTPFIHISLHHEGISPEDSERLLLRPLEQKLKSIEGIKEIRSTAFENGGVVLLEFFAGSHLEKALSDVREQVNQAKSEFPHNTDKPIIREVNLSLFPVLVINLSGDIPQRALSKIAQDLRESIESEVASVLHVNIVGNPEETLEVIVEPSVLEMYKLSLNDIIQLFKANNSLASAGTLDRGKGRFPVKIPGLFTSSFDILNTPMGIYEDAVLRLSDIAKIRRTFKDPSGFARDQGKPAIALEVSKRIGENIIETIENVRRVVERERQNWPPNLMVSFSQDQSHQIHEMLTDLQNNIIAAVLLVVGVIFFFLGWRSSLLVALAIPGSFLMGVLVLSTMGFTINIVVLFSLILSVGMLVDAAIIVVDYADCMMAEGYSPFEAFKIGSKRMTWPAITSTVTIIAAFFPLLFWPGIVGQFMKFLPLTLVATLTASILMAIIFIPTLGSLFGKSHKMRKKGQNQGHQTDFLHKTLNQAKNPMTGTYVRLLDRCLNHPGTVLLTVLGFMIGIILLTKQFGRGVEFFPNVDPSVVMLEVRARGNLSALEVIHLVKRVEGRILDMQEFKSIYTNTDLSANSHRQSPELFPDTVGTITLELTDWQKRRKVHAILSEILKRTQNIPGIFVEARKEESGPPQGKPIQIQLTSQHPEALLPTLAKIRARVETVKGLASIEDSAPIPGLEWHIAVDRAQAAKFNASVALIGTFVQLIANGFKLDTFRPDDSKKEIDILLRYPEEYRNLNQLSDMMIQTNEGVVPLSLFTKQEFKPKSQKIERVNGMRVFTVKADIQPNILADQKIQELKTWLKSEKLDPRVQVTFKGEEKNKKETFVFLCKAFAVTIFLITLILLTQFNSFFSTAVVLSAIVLSTMGVMVGLLLTQQPFGIVMGGIGVIALAGIIVSNNIILIDTFDQLKPYFKDVKERILQTGTQRLRPVFLTKITAILGLLPMAFKLNIDFIHGTITYDSPSSQWWAQLSCTIIFGILFAGVLTLIVTPCFLMLRENYRKCLCIWFYR